MHCYQMMLSNNHNPNHTGNHNNNNSVLFQDDVIPSDDTVD